jgi:hypothetical protein
MRRYAAAIGILLGTAIGLAIGVPLKAPWLGGVFSLVGLIIGYVISQGAQPSGEQPISSKPDRATADRLRELEKLRDESLITDEEYQERRKGILDDL